MKYGTPILILSFVALFISASTLNAQEKEAFYVPYNEMTKIALLHPASSAERIGMMFFKMAGIQPDFEPWAPKTIRSQRVPEYDRYLVALQELSRLQNEYENLTNGDPIIIRSVVDVSEYSPQQEILFLKQITSRTLFKYDAHGLPIVLLAKGLDRFSQIKLPPKEADYFLNKLQGRDKAKLQIKVIPERVEPERPVDLNDGTYYPMIVNVAEFSLWTNDNDDPAQMWVYRAPWFDDINAKRNLLDLYSR